MKKFYFGLITGLILGLIISVTNVAIADNPIRMLVNGKEINSDVAPQIVNDRTMVPLRVIAEALDMEVTWDNDTRTVFIKTKTEPFSSKPQVEPPQPQEPQIPSEDVIPKTERVNENIIMPSIPSNYEDNANQTVPHPAKEDPNDKARQYIWDKIEQIRSEGSVGYWSSESSYNMELSSKQKERQQYQNQLNALALDDSMETKYRKNELTQKIERLDSDIKEMQERRTRQVRIDNLKQQLENY